MQNNSLARPFRGYVEIAAVPYGVHKIRVAYARKRTFGAEGNGYLAVESFSLVIILVNAYAGVVYFKIPLAVEAKPGLSFSVRARMLRAWYIIHITVSFRFVDISIIV
jgi:hypothetical protein